jgi:hypothetical protein
LVDPNFVFHTCHTVTGPLFVADIFGHYCLCWFMLFLSPTIDAYIAFVDACFPYTILIRQIIVGSLSFLVPFVVLQLISSRTTNLMGFTKLSSG